MSNDKPDMRPAHASLATALVNTTPACYIAAGMGKRLPCAASIANAVGRFMEDQPITTTCTNDQKQLDELVRTMTDLGEMMENAGKSMRETAMYLRTTAKHDPMNADRLNREAQAKGKQPVEAHG